jgi:hypothetical protein
VTILVTYHMTILALLQDKENEDAAEEEEGEGKAEN